MSLLLASVGIGHCLLSYTSTLRGISKLQLDADKLATDLDNSWEVLAEPIQTVRIETVCCIMWRRQDVRPPHAGLLPTARIPAHH